MLHPPIPDWLSLNKMYGCNLWYQLCVDMPQDVWKCEQKSCTSGFDGNIHIGRIRNLPMPVSNHMSDAGSGHLFTMTTCRCRSNQIYLMSDAGSIWLPILVLLWYFSAGSGSFVLHQTCNEGMSDANLSKYNSLPDLAVNTAEFGN